METEMVELTGGDVKVHMLKDAFYASQMTPAMVRVASSFGMVAEELEKFAGFFEGRPVYTKSQGNQIPPAGDQWVSKLDVVSEHISLEKIVDLVMDKMYGQHAGKAVVPCQHCGQWGARYCACRECGAAID